MEPQRERDLLPLNLAYDVAIIQVGKTSKSFLIYKTNNMNMIQVLSFLSFTYILAAINQVKFSKHVQDHLKSKARKLTANKNPKKIGHNTTEQTNI